MTSKQEKLIENYIRRKVISEMSKTKKNRLKEEFDSDGHIYDKMQNDLWNQLEILIGKWAQVASSKLKKYCKSAGEDVDEEVLIDEFFQEFSNQDMWNEFTNNYR